MADIRVKDLTEAAVPGADYFLLTDSAADGVKKVKTTNIVKPEDIGAASLAGVETLTNKTISGASNTLSNIPNSALANSSVTIAGHTVALGGSQAIAAGDLSAIANQTILANVSGGSAAPAPTNLSSILDAVIGSTQGSIITRKAAGWSILGPGPSGTMLTSMGTAADLAYTAIPGGGGPIPIFDTFALAQAYSPAAAPKWIKTAFYDTNQVPNSGAKYIKDAGADLTITLSDGVTTVNYGIQNKIINAAAFGLSPSNTAAQNKTILKAVAARTATNGRFIVPDFGASVIVDTTGGLSDAIKIDRKMTVQIDGSLKANYSAYEANPAFIFNVTAHSVVFEGTGTIEGDGAFSVGGSTTLNMPGLVFADSVNNFRFRGIRSLRPPQTAIMLAACNRAIISKCEMSGGPTSFQMSFIPPNYTDANPSYLGSAHFGIVASGGGDHTFSKIHFTKDEFNGRFINCIFPSGVYGNSNGNKTLHCIAYYPYEKLLYGYGDKQVIAGNTVYGSGTSSVDTHTEAIRIWGSDCRAYGNLTFGCRSGMQVLDGARNHVFGNEFKDCRSSGVNVQHFSDSYTGGIDGNKVTGNYISRDGSSVERRFGVRVLSNTLMDLSLCEVSGNTLVGWGDTTAEVEYAVDVVAQSPRVAYKCAVKDNTLYACGNGVRATRNISTVIDGNDLNNCTSIAIHIQAGARNIVENNTGENPGTYFLSYSGGGNEPTGSVFRNNSCVGATNVGIRNHASFNANDIMTVGNKWTSKSLVVPFNLSTSAGTFTVTHGGVAPHAKVRPSPDEVYSAAFLANEGMWCAYKAGGDIECKTGTGSVASVAGACFAEVLQ
jgi:hypothetical protein